MFDPISFDFPPLPDTSGLTPLSIPEEFLAHTGTDSQSLPTSPDTIRRFQSALSSDTPDQSFPSPLLAKYAEVELLLKIGEYKRGSDPETDEAIAKNAAVNAYLRQALDERPTYDESISRLKQAVS